MDVCAMHNSLLRGESNKKPHNFFVQLWFPSGSTSSFRRLNAEEREVEASAWRLICS